MYSMWIKTALFISIELVTSVALAQGTFTDERDGTTYKTVQIGKETWLAENMKYVAEEISCRTDSRHGSSIKNYGCLYSWADAQKVCPSGWHLPTKVEFTRLLSQVGEGKEGSDNLRDISWQDGKNESGFSALPAGRYESGSYENFGSGAYFWSQTRCDNEGVNAGSLTLLPGRVSVKKCHNMNTEWLSVRCLKDTEEVVQGATFTDERDGTTYKTVEIGQETWLAENMKYIAADIDYKVNSKQKEYGALYTFKNAQKVCPAGWRLPSKVDFERLLNQVGKGTIGSDNLRHKTWDRGKNVSGFSALPAGSCDKSGCSFFDTDAYFWSSTAYKSNKAYGLYVDSGKALVTSGKRSSYLAVRCIRGSNEEAAITSRSKSSANPKNKGNKKLLAASITAGALGGALAVTGIALISSAAIYSAKSHEAEDEFRGNEPITNNNLLSQTEAAAIAQRGRSMEVASYVTFGITGAAVATAIIFGVKYQKSKKKLDKQSVTIAPAVSKKAALLTIGARW